MALLRGKNADELVPLYYKKIGRHDNYPGEWNFNKYKNDIIFINLGANDYFYYMADPDKRGEEFIQEYIKFLDLIKECNPSSIIICTMSYIERKVVYTLVQKAVELYNDEKVFCFEVPEYEIDKYGSDYHPSESSKEKVGKIVADNIKEIINKYFK